MSVMNGGSIIVESRIANSGPRARERRWAKAKPAREHHLSVVMSELQGRHTPDRSWVQDVLTRRPTGVIAVYSSLSEDQTEQLRGRGIPLALLDPTGEPGHASPSVGASNWNGGLAATRHLLQLGHRRIAVITGPAKALASRARLDGHRAAMDMAGAAVDPRTRACGRL